MKWVKQIFNGFDCAVVNLIFLMVIIHLPDLKLWSDTTFFSFQYRRMKNGNENYLAETALCLLSFIMFFDDYQLACSGVPHNNLIKRNSFFLIFRGKVKESQKRLFSLFSGIRIFLNELSFENQVFCVQKSLWAWSLIAFFFFNSKLYAKRDKQVSKSESMVFLIFSSKFQNIHCFPFQSLTYFTIPNLKYNIVCIYHYKFQYLDESVAYQKILRGYSNRYIRC